MSSNSWRSRRRAPAPAAEHERLVVDRPVAPGRSGANGRRRRWNSRGPPPPTVAGDIVTFNSSNRSASASARVERRATLRPGRTRRRGRVRGAGSIAVAQVDLVDAGPQHVDTASASSMCACSVVMTNPAPERNSSRSCVDRAAAGDHADALAVLLRRAVPSPRTVPAPTMMTSATERSCCNTPASFSLDRPAETPSTTVEPSIDATMHSPTQGRSARRPSGDGVCVGDRDRPVGDGKDSAEWNLHRSRSCQICLHRTMIETTSGTTRPPATYVPALRGRMRSRDHGRP